MRRLRPGRGTGRKVLRSFEPSPEVFTTRLRAALGEGGVTSSTEPPRAAFTKRVLHLGLREALGMGTTTSAPSTCI